MSRRAKPVGQDDAPDGETIARYWLEGGKLLHSLEVPHGRGVEALHFASDSLDDLVCKGGRTMIASDRTAVHVFEAGATAGRPAQIVYSLDLAKRRAVDFGANEAGPGTS